MKFYIQTDTDNVIRDIIEMPHPGYKEIEADLPLPIGVMGGWYRWQDGFVYDETLYEKATPPSETATKKDIQALGQQMTDLELLIMEGASNV